MRMLNFQSDTIRIEAADDLGPGGANHKYQIHFFKDKEWQKGPRVDFQCGAVPEVGPNGVTNEALLAIMIDHVGMFQKGPYSCRENALALTKMEEALHWFEARTRDRKLRGVEGVYKQ